MNQPILNQRPKTHYKFQIRKFSSHTSLFWTLPEQITPRVCTDSSWTNVPKIHHKTSDPKILISHIPVLNFAGTARHFRSRMWANPSCTNVPKYPTNKWLNFANPSSSNLPKLTSQNFNVHLTGGKNVEPYKKTRSNKNLCTTFRPKMVLSKLQWLKLPAPNLLQKCSQEVFPRLKSFDFILPHLPDEGY